MVDGAWRFIADRNSYADFSVSVSPAIERAVVRGEVPPTVCLNIFDCDSITIGVNEDPEQVLDIDFCRARGIDFRRRVNGGGAIYAGTGSAFLIYYVPTSDAGVPESTAEAFPRILEHLARTFRDLYGIAAEYRPLNDVQVEGRKLVPTSLKIEDGVMTFRIVINVKEIDTHIAAGAMPMPPEKVQDKALKDLQSRFTCLEREVGRALAEDELIALARTAAARAFHDPPMYDGSLTAVEAAYAEAFRKQYDNDAWLFGKSLNNRLSEPLQMDDTIGLGRHKALGGMIWFTLVVRNGSILHAILNGDWHPRPIESVRWIEEALTGQKAGTTDIHAALHGFLERPDVEFAGVGLDDLMEAVSRSLANQKPALGHGSIAKQGSMPSSRCL